MKRFFLALLLLPLFASADCKVVETIRIGVAEDELSGRDRPIIEERLQTVAAALAPEYAVDVRYFPRQELSATIERNRVDAFISSSARYRRSLASGPRDIAVLMPAGAENPNRLAGAVFLADIDRLDISSVKNLKGGRALRAGERSLTVDMSAEGELLQSGIADPKSFFADVRYAGTDVGSAVDLLLAGKADLLVLPACALEHYAQTSGRDTGRLTVLSPKEDRDLACLHSTNLYPGLTFAAMPSLSHNAYNRILRSLVFMKSSESSGMWAMATDFSALDKTLHRLNSDAWAPFREPTLERMIKRYWPWIAGASGTIFLVLTINILLRRLVKRRTMELQAALNEQKRLRVESDRVRNRLDKMRRLQTIGQLAGLFAHELRQPLNAVGCYAYGLRKAFSRTNSLSSPDIQTGIDGIDAEIRRANAIVERVREYVRSQSSRNSEHALSDITTAAVGNFKLSAAGVVPIKLTIENPEKSVVRCDPMEMELVIVNLLRNAAEVQNASPSPLIRVTVTGGINVMLTVSDNGPALSDAELSDIVSVGESTKPEGLGLGLSIVRDLVDAHHGVIKFSRTAAGSLEVRIVLPSADKEELLL